MGTVANIADRRLIADKASSLRKALEDVEDIYTSARFDAFQNPEAEQLRIIKRIVSKALLTDDGVCEDVQTLVSP